MFEINEKIINEIGKENLYKNNLNINFVEGCRMSCAFTGSSSAGEGCRMNCAFTDASTGGAEGCRMSCAYTEGK
ncbi:MAG: hypothetical protein LBL60_02095 [Mycoplasmataceae bacterium]|nr:hypothetical protein [Mycoplasmataceae bacterium]